MTLVALEVGRYELRPLIELLEERGSTDMCRDAGGITMAIWERWAAEGLSAAEAEAAAAGAGALVAAVWPTWRPEAETAPDDARTLIEALRAQLEAS